MRLIDADVLIQYLGFENTEEERENNIGEIITLEDLDNQPTAYDIDKVVDELEQHYDDDSVICGLGYNDAIKKAIEIVKQGGISLSIRGKECNTCDELEEHDL